MLPGPSVWAMMSTSVFMCVPSKRTICGQCLIVWIQYPLNVELHETANGFEVKAACMSDVADNAGLRNLVVQYASMLRDIVRHPEESWSLGIPEIPVEPLSTATASADNNVPKEDVQVWDDRFDAFREVLATTTKVPASNIHPGTALATLGIDSITAVQISAKTRRVGFRLTSAEIVQSRTVADLLKKLQVFNTTATVDPAATPSIDIPHDHWSSIVSPELVELVEKITPASAGMEWMVGMWQRSRGSRFQHTFAYRLPVDVDSLKLRSAWDQLIRKHAVLRSTFAYDSEGGALRTVIFKPEALASSWSEESLEASEDPSVIVQQQMKEIVSSPPSVNRPFTRAVFLKFPQANYMVMHLHHFQYDAWSLQLLADDFSRIYAGEAPRSSSDIDSFLRHAVPSADVEREQMQYWKTTLQADRAALLPSLLSESISSRRDVYTNYAAISGASKLDKVAREQAVSLQNVFLASWAQIQARHSQSDSPVFSLWHSGRTGDVKDVERMAVPCINVLPFRVSGARTGETLALARHIQEGLQARSTVVEQSRLTKVHEWVGCGEEPLSNVFVNIVKVAPDVEKNDAAFLQSLEVNTVANYIS